MTDQSHTQPQTFTSTTTGVFALLKAKPGVTRERVMAIMPAEIRATVQLYLDGKIREWYAREDGKGAVFLLNTRNVAEAESIMESLPLAQEKLPGSRVHSSRPAGADTSAIGEPVSQTVAR